MLKLKQLIRAIKKAIDDNRAAVDLINLKTYNDQFKECLEISDPRERLMLLEALLYDVDPPDYDG